MIGKFILAGEIGKKKYFLKLQINKINISTQKGNCWFIVASIVVTNHKELTRNIIPTNQSFEPGDYCGAFHFNFWHYGEWTVRNYSALSS